MSVGLLDEANHSLVTLHVEMLSRIGLHLRGKLDVLDVVSEVGHESLTVVKLNKEGLVVEHVPCAVNFVAVGKLSPDL